MLELSLGYRKALTLDIRAPEQHVPSERAPHTQDVQRKAPNIGSSSSSSSSMKAAGMRLRVLAADQQSATQRLQEPGIDYLAKYFSRHSCTSPVRLGLGLGPTGLWSPEQAILPVP
jgi:hypothetical protein